ncbi:MAG: cation diffusion facilitator family transporter [Armatimonadetes bacterium]|nr:cation diffusion facilitator family transporter [Armatimonadota bacterium]
MTRAVAMAGEEGRVLVGTAALSVASNAGLVIAKGAVGLATGSLSVVSEALHSFNDLLAAVIALAAVSMATRPADDHHEFGHGKYESLSATVEGLLLFGAAAWIVFEAIKRLGRPPEHIPALPGIIVMATGVVLNTLISAVLLRTAQRYGSPALRADGVHLRADVVTSAAVLAGLAFIHFGAPTWVDTLLAILVAIVVVVEGYGLVAHGVRDLLDAALPKSEREIIEEVLRNYQNGPYVGYHDLRTRHSGRRHEVEVHVVVCQQLTVGEAHGISEELEETMHKALPNTRLVVHVEPCDEEECTKLLSRGQMPDRCKRREAEATPASLPEA